METSGSQGIARGFRVGKAWPLQGLGIVWQLEAPRTMAAAVRKHFLLMELRSGCPTVRIIPDKPKLLAATGGIGVMFRKWTSGSVLCSVRRTEDGRCLAIPFQRRHGSTAWVVCTDADGGQLELRDGEDVSLLRWTPKGLYTRKKTPLLSRQEVEAWPEAIHDLVADLLASPSVGSVDGDSEGEEATHDGLSDASSDGISVLQRTLRKKLVRRLRTVRKACEKSRRELPTDQDLAQAEQAARLLQSFSHLVVPDCTELRLTPVQTGLDQEVVIAVDPEMSVGANIDTLFVAVKKKKRARQLGERRLQSEDTQLAALEQVVARLQTSALTEAELATIASTYRIQVGTISAARRSDASLLAARQYRAYELGNAKFLVGKGPKENDGLTKSAKSNDYWFHVVATTGSHVIVPAKTISNGQIPEKTKRQAGILAIHFSRLRQDRAGEVYFARKQHLKKKKGMPPGLWVVEKSDNFFVKYDQAELQEILDAQSSQ